MKTSVNFKAVKIDSEARNFRRKTFDYIRKDLTGKNEYCVENKISDRFKSIEVYYKEKSRKNNQSNKNIFSISRMTDISNYYKINNMTFRPKLEYSNNEHRASKEFTIKKEGTIISIFTIF
ncbi:hypothetical protein [Chryseobacterium oleae]|nr:hypothetical protein [Chryseobacterium oleae]